MMTPLLRLILLVGALTVPALWAGAVFAAQGEGIFHQKCLSCHELTGPLPSTIVQAKEQKAPPLFYAGWKYQRDWLVSWMQEPVVLYRAGYILPNIVADTEGGDQIDPSNVESCASALSADEAATVADHLMSLRPAEFTVAQGELKGKVSNRKGYMMFTKQYACVGCHKINYRGLAKGGVSGTDLSNAGKRLNANWVADYMADPVRWVGPTPKPVYKLSAKKQAAFTGFVISQGVEK